MSKLFTCVAALLLLLGTHGAFAHDDDDDWGRDRYDRHDNGRGLAWGRRDRDHCDRKHWDDGDRVSINLSIGTIPDWRYRDYYRARSRIGMPYTTTWGPPVNVWRYDDRPVIVHQNNTYINAAPRTRVVRRPGRNSTSLYRDIDGRCYEREIDSRGTETRTELPGSVCNF